MDAHMVENVQHIQSGMLPDNLTAFHGILFL